MSNKEIVLVYDGMCPMCSSVSKYIKLKKVAGKLQLIDARKNKEMVKKLKKKNIDLNLGMVVITGGKYYHGSDAANIIALMSSRSDLFNKINYILFSSKTIGQFIYPIFKCIRSFLLWMKGYKNI